MALNTNIPLMARGIELQNPMENALAAQKIQGAQMDNALRTQEMQQMQSPDYQAKKQEAERLDRAIKLSDATAKIMSSVKDQNSYNLAKPMLQQLHPEQPLPEVWQPDAAAAGKAQHDQVMAQLLERQAQLQNELLGTKIKRNQAPQAGGAVNPATGAAPQPAPNLPVPALKLEQEAKDNVNTAQMISRDMDAYMQQIESGQLDLGPVKNLANRGRNWAGMSTQQSVNLAGLDAGLQKLRNDSLRLNKGPQTDGDADRAWQELIANINDPVVVKTAMAKIKRLNENAAQWHMQQANAVRQNFGAPPVYDIGNQPQSAQPAAQSRQLSPQDQQAMQWAQMNPNDPRAQAIMDRLGAR